VTTPDDQTRRSTLRVSRAEAMRIADANHQRVEELLRSEVERDAQGTAVWEDDSDEAEEPDER
jgi:hypothetical protein